MWTLFPVLLVVVDLVANLVLHLGITNSKISKLRDLSNLLSGDIHKLGYYAHHIHSYGILVSFRQYRLRGSAFAVHLRELELSASRPNRGTFPATLRLRVLSNPFRRLVATTKLSGGAICEQTLPKRQTDPRTQSTRLVISWQTL